MKTYEVERYLLCRDRRNYTIEAESEEEAKEKALSGEIEPEDDSGIEIRDVRDI